MLKILFPEALSLGVYSLTQGPMIKNLTIITTLTAIAASQLMASTILVRTSDPGYYNMAIGTVLNDTNGGETGPFPVSDDASRRFATAPDLMAASSALGNWLPDPFHLNSNWNFLTAIPNNWALGTEVGVVYQFNTFAATNVVASFGVDNGIFVWLDGTYLFGARDPGGVSPGEYVIPIGNFAAGTHFLQLILEDHGVTNGYDVQITADTFVPGPPSSPTPEPSTYLLMLIASTFFGVRWLRAKSHNQSL